MPRKTTDRLIGSAEYQRSADDRQREVLDEIRRLGARIATAERDLANDKTTLDKLIQILEFGKEEADSILDSVRDGALQLGSRALEDVD